MVKQKTRDYEALVAGMRHRPTIFDMDEEMKKGIPRKACGQQMVADVE